MSEPLTVDAALSLLSPEPGLVILMCGVAGSGKTSFSTKLASKGFTRLSIDEEIWGRLVDMASTTHQKTIPATWLWHVTR